MGNKSKGKSRIHAYEIKFLRNGVGIVNRVKNETIGELKCNYCWTEYKDIGKICMKKMGRNRMPTINMKWS